MGELEPHPQTHEDDVECPLFFTLWQQVRRDSALAPRRLAQQHDFDVPDRLATSASRPSQRQGFAAATG